MKPVLIYISSILMLYSCSHKTVSTVQPNPAEKYKDFSLWYSYAGLGSGFGSVQPRFTVNGVDYIYTQQQNSFYNQPDKKPEMICEGQLRTNSIDSIIDLVRDIKDTLIYRTNTGVMSGGIHSIAIHFHQINLTFDLHNATDTTAQKIVNILNSNIPGGKDQLWLFNMGEGKSFSIPFPVLDTAIIPDKR